MSTTISKTARNPEVEAKYQAFLRANKGECRFCQLAREDTDDPQVLKNYKHFTVINNIFPYAEWDEHSVAEHSMIIPRSHHIEFRDFTNEESAEFIGLLSRYENLGFSVYARSKSNKARSMPHQHTHLIKLES